MQQHSANTLILLVEFERLETIEMRFKKTANVITATAFGDEGSGDVRVVGACRQLGFVLDKSTSVSNRDFRLGLEIVSEIVKLFNSKYRRVTFTLITYSEHADLIANGTDGSQISQVVRNARRKAYGPTVTRRGLDMARDTLVFTRPNCYECIPPTEMSPVRDYYTYPCPTCIKRCRTFDCSDCCRTLLFLITDGKSHWAVNPRKAAQCLKHNDVEMFAIGITSSVDLSELRYRFQASVRLPLFYSIV